MDGGCLSYVSEQFGEFGGADLSDLKALAESGSVNPRGSCEGCWSHPDISAVRVDGDWQGEISNFHLL